MNKLKKTTGVSRREFLGKSAATLAGIALVTPESWGVPNIIRNLNKPNSNFGGVQIGVITYSFRSLPVDAESVLRYCVDANISAIELMGPTAEAFAGVPHTVTEPGRQSEGGNREREARAKDLAQWRAHVAMDKFVQLRKMFNDAGVSIYAYKPSALGERNSDVEIDYAMRAAKALGANHVTVELQKNPNQSARLGRIAALNKMVVAYHGHLQQTFTAWDEALAQSEYNGINLDAGHYVAAGHDPLAFIEAKHERIYSMHLKDRRSPANGQANVPWGEGDTPIADILCLMRKNKYKFPGTIELEYPVPEGSDAVKEVARCVEYCRKALEC